MGDFYVTLPSNSSMDLFPENKTSNYTIKLAKKITVTNKCKVGVAEIHIPLNIVNVTENNNSIFINFENKIKLTVKIKCKVYRDLNEIIEAINDAFQEIPVIAINRGLDLLMNDTNDGIIVKKMRMFLRPTFFGEDGNMLLEQIDQRSNFYSIEKIDPNYKHKEPNRGLILRGVTFQNRLSLQLGFPFNGNALEFGTSPYPVGLHLGLPEQIFVYCDLIDFQFVGNFYSKIIKIVTLDNTEKLAFGTIATKNFSPIQYMPLCEREIEQINVQIRTAQGDLYPFEFGTFTVQLHFVDDY
jgi:hypothetical protein